MQQPALHRLPGQQTLPASPQRAQVPYWALSKVQMLEASLQVGGVLPCWQQVWPTWPHSHCPALQAPVLPAQVCPSATQRFCQQHAEPPHLASAQHTWPGPPQAWQVPPKGALQIAPSLQEAGSS
jgi:hypothetical protein